MQVYILYVCRAVDTRKNVIVEECVILVLQSNRIYYRRNYKMIGVVFQSHRLPILEHVEKTDERLLHNCSVT